MKRIFSLGTKLIFSLSTKKTKYSYSPLVMSHKKNVNVKHQPPAIIYHLQQKNGEVK
jgi:hypothetical protein